MSNQKINLVLERQLLLQLGDRLKRLRKAQGLGTVELSAMAGLTRTTLRSIESGDPSPSMGAYLRVMTALGVSGELALLAGDSVQAAPKSSAAARSRRRAPVVQVQVSVDDAEHRLQDLQSLALHEAAIRAVKEDPKLLIKAQQTLQRWIASGDSRSVTLWREWEQILTLGSWRKALGRSTHAQQLRQSSPLVTILPEEIRTSILKQISSLKKGVVFGNSMIRSGQGENTREVS